jgi:hypothetical protein
MKHFASRAFWEAYGRLPKRVRDLADKNYALLKDNPQHPSLQFKKVGRFWYALRSIRANELIGPQPPPNVFRIPVVAWQ